MKLSIIIPAYNDLARVMRCVNSLKLTAIYDNEILIQDDHSPLVNFEAVVPAGYASVQRNPANYGFAVNCNAGAARATGDIIVLCNQDVYAIPAISHGWDAAILNAFGLRDDIGIVGARLLFPDGKIQSAGGLFDARLQPYHRCLGYQNIDHREVSTPEVVSWCTGAFLAVHKELWDALSGFDTVYKGGYFEDVDLCVRAQLAGAKVWYDPRATLVHEVGTTGGSVYFAQNAQTFKTRWVEAGFIKQDVPAVYERFW